MEGTLANYEKEIFNQEGKGSLDRPGEEKSGQL